MKRLICAKFGKDLFNISKVIGRKKVAQFFWLTVYIGCRQNHAASRGLLATAWLSCYQWERNKRELVADRIIDVRRPCLQAYLLCLGRSDSASVDYRPTTTNYDNKTIEWTLSNLCFRDTLEKFTTVIVFSRQY